MERVAELPAANPRSLFLALVLSLLFHAFFLALLALRSLHPPSASAPLNIELLRPEEAREREQAARRRAAPERAPAPEQAPDLPAPERPRNQIVAPPDSPEAKPDHARLLSDRDSRADQETVKRGESPKPPPSKSVAKADRPAPAKPAPPRTASRGAAEARPPAQSRARAAELAARDGTMPMPSLNKLFAKPSEVVNDPALKDAFRSGDPAEESGSRDYAAVTPPDLFTAPGERGTLDYLPDTRQGSFTLLNTKADRFAPFVRRVGLRVFQSFSADFKQMIFAGTVPQGKERVEVEAVMSPDGRRLEVVVKGRNGNLATDRVLLGTLNDQIFFDKNPPAAAVAEDGRIHFVFELDAAVWYGHDQQSGLPQPGAHWIFGAGLL